MVALESSNADSKFGYREGRSNRGCSYKGLKVVCAVWEAGKVMVVETCFSCLQKSSY